MLRSQVRNWLALALLGIAPMAAQGAESVRPLAELPALAEMPERWSQVMDLFDVPGMAIAVVSGDRVYAQGFGIRDPKSAAPVTPETLFYIASITKTFTATTVCALADDKRLSLDDPVRKHLPRFQLADSALTRTLTVRDLMSHRYGVHSEPIVLLDAFTGEISEDRFYHWLPSAQVKGSIEYTNLHYTLLGRVIEAVTGRPWRDELVTRVLEPARMPRTTGYASQMYGDPNVAVPLQRAGDGWEPVELRKNDRTMHAAGGLGTSAVEAGRWLRLHLQNGTLDGKRILSAESARAMRATETKLEKPEGTIRVIEGFGLAWNVGSFNGHRFCQHGGGYPGASAYVAMLPDDGIGVFVLMNASGAARGLGDIVAIDVLERTSGTKSAWDVYERYTTRAREQKAKAAAEAESAQGTAGTPEGASAGLPAQAAGVYSNPWWGTLEVRSQGAALAYRLGDLLLEVEPSEAAADQFVVDLLDEKTRGHFVPGADGNIESIELDHPKFGAVVFRR